MSDRAPRPTLTGTGAQKRATEDRMLRQVYQSLRETHTRIGHLLDVVGGILFEREQREADEAEPVPVPPPAPAPAPIVDDPHRRPTSFHKKTTAADFLESVQTRWEEARSEGERANVLELLQRGHDQGLINDEELEATTSRLQRR